MKWLTALPKRHYGGAILLVICALSVLVAALIEQEAPGAYALWGLGVGMAVCALYETPVSYSVWGRRIGWGILGAAFVMVWFSPFSWMVWLGLLALTAFYSSWQLTVRLLVPFWLLAVAVSASGFLYLLLSFPLSRICTALTVAALRLGGVSCTFDRAIILVGESQVAVTAACSGIELLEAMLLLGWLIVRLEQRNFLMRLVHFLLLLPIIIVMNTARLVLVIGLSRVIGERAFDNTLHVILGYAVVIGTVLLMLAAGKLFQGGEGKRS